MGIFSASDICIGTAIKCAKAYEQFKARMKTKVEPGTLVCKTVSVKAKQGGQTFEAHRFTCNGKANALYERAQKLLRANPVNSKSKLEALLRKWKWRSGVWWHKYKKCHAQLGARRKVVPSSKQKQIRRSVRSKVRRTVAKPKQHSCTATCNVRSTYTRNQVGYYNRTKAISASGNSVPNAAAKLSGKCEEVLDNEVGPSLSGRHFYRISVYGVKCYPAK